MTARRRPAPGRSRSTCRAVDAAGNPSIAVFNTLGRIWRGDEVPPAPTGLRADGAGPGPVRLGRRSRPYSTAFLIHIGRCCAAGARGDRKVTSRGWPHQPPEPAAGRDEWQSLRAEIAADRERDLAALSEQLTEYGARRETDGYLSGMRTAASEPPEPDVRSFRRPPAPR